MRDRELPHNAQEITVDWLNRVLRSESSGLVLDGDVTSFSVESLGEGKGFMNQVVRIRLYTSEESLSPHLSMVAKFPSQDPEIKALNVRVGDDNRESMFYREIAAVADMPTPDLYFSDSDGSIGNSVLMIEDLSDARLGDSVEGCSSEEIQLAIHSLAEFQADYWGNVAEMQYAWLPAKSADTEIYSREYDQAWKALKVKAGDAMPDHLWELGQELGQHIGAIRTHLSTAPLTLVHGDYRPDNCFFGGEFDRRPLAVFDWEYCTKGRGVYDVATFLCEVFTPEQRIRHELDCLRLYHSQLLDGGVSGYTFDQCLTDYRLSFLDLIVFWAITGSACDWTSQRATQYLRNSLERMDAAVTEHESMKLLAEE